MRLSGSRRLAERDDRNRSATDARIIELERERAEVAAAYRAALRRVAEHRPAFADKIDAALAPWRLDAAKRALAAADALEAAVGDLTAANRAAAAAGIEPQVATTRPDLHRLRAALRRQAELAGGAAK